MEVLHNQGATPERKEKSNIVTAARVLTKGGMIQAYGHHDTEHCALDWLLQKGFIEKDHYDTGYRLRTIYFDFHTTGICLEEMGGGGYRFESEEETRRDKAEQLYKDIMIALPLQYRAMTEYVCIDAKIIPARYGLMGHITDCLDELYKVLEKIEK